MFVCSFFSLRLQGAFESAHEIMVLITYRRPAKAQASLRIRAVSPEPSLFARMKNGSRRRVRPKLRHLAPLDACACAFEELVYGGRKVPQSHDMAHLSRNMTNQQNECAPSEDSDQPGHPPSLIRVFAVRMKNLGSLATH